MNTWALLLLVTVTWFVWAIGTVQAHCIAKCEGRVKPDAGVSIAPIIPIFPIVFFGLAKVVDRIVPPWGSWLVGGLHAVLAVSFVVVILWQAFRHRRKAPYK